MKNKMTPSRYFAWFITISGIALSAYLKDSTYFALAIPSAVGLYINKQHTEKKNETDKQFKDSSVN